MPYKMKNGKWRAHRMINGKRKTKVFLKKQEAAKWEASQAREFWQKSEIPTICLLDWSNSYLDAAQGLFVEKTYKEKRACFKLFFKTVDPYLSVDSLSSATASKYLSAQSERRSGYAANKDRKNLRAAWSWGIKYMNLPASNPFDVERFPEVRTPRYVPDIKDMDAILSNETGEVRCFLLTLLHTAARKSELFRLRWSDIDFERSTVRLYTRKRKGGSLEYDLVPLTGALSSELLSHKKTTNSVFVFSQENGQPFSSRTHLMKRVCKRAGVRYFGFHAIRHLSACMMDQSGVDLSTIQAILRHKSATTTARYLHSLRGVKIELDSVFGEVQSKEKAPAGQGY